MVRKYVKVVGPTRRSNYDESNLKQAVRDVISKKLSVRMASGKYCVPKSTVSAHVLAQRIGEEVLKSGGQPV